MEAHINPQLYSLRIPILKYIPDLTGHVKRTELYSFACGGNADIFKGEHLGRPVSVIIILLFLFVLSLVSIMFQVAVKVLKGAQDPGEFRV
jgi:hypothetical protein